nr:S41 family peptidase [Clostridia bacterium]
MTKKISVWLAIFLVIFACAITFQLTVIFGGAFSRYEPEVTLPQVTEEIPETTAPEEKEPTFEEELFSRVNEKVSTILSLYTQYFVGDINIDDVVEGAAEGIVAYMGDKYGDYHTKEEYEELMQGYSGEFAGIGVSVVYNPDYGAIEILQVMNNSPALEGGLLPNDLIVAVNGESVLALGYNEALNRIRGEVGTTVTITIARGKDYAETLDVTLTRRTVEEESVTYELIEVKNLFRPLAYIRLLDFNHLSAEQFIDAVAQGGADKVHGYIIDLRNNGGGELASVVAMLDALLPEGPIVRIQYKDGTEKVYESDKNATKGIFTVLVNDNTASAAELFISALRDYGKAIIVGETTYGKGTVQSIIALKDGDAVRISTSMYLPPFTDNFEGIGVTPDIEVKLPDELKNINLFKLSHDDDTQLQAAINLYK